MKYIITEEERQFVMNALGNVVANVSFKPLLVLNQLPIYEELKEEPKTE